MFCCGAHVGVPSRPHPPPPTDPSPPHGHDRRSSFCLRRHGTSSAPARWILLWRCIVLWAPVTHRPGSRGTRTISCPHTLLLTPPPPSLPHHHSSFALTPRFSPLIALTLSCWRLRWWFTAPAPHPGEGCRTHDLHLRPNWCLLLFCLIFPTRNLAQPISNIAASHT